jgi:hypothetical protein
MQNNIGFIHRVARFDQTDWENLIPAHHGEVGVMLINYLVHDFSSFLENSPVFHDFDQSWKTYLASKTPRDGDWVEIAKKEVMRKEGRGKDPHGAGHGTPHTPHDHHAHHAHHDKKKSGSISSRLLDLVKNWS